MSKLYFFNSVMNSGKSAHIIMQVYNLMQKGYKVIVLKPSLDSRDFGVVKSRALKTDIEANLIDQDFKIFDFVKEQNPDYVFVDEVNFLTEEQANDLADIVDELDISVYCYGLLRDFQGKLFAGSKRLIELADSIRELKSQCLHCKNKATHHLRKLNGVYVFTGQSVEVGDMDLYESVCRKCFNKEYKKYKEKFKKGE